MGAVHQWERKASLIAFLGRGYALIAFRHTRKTVLQGGLYSVMGDVKLHSGCQHHVVGSLFPYGICHPNSEEHGRSCVMHLGHALTHLTLSAGGISKLLFSWSIGLLVC